MKLIIILMTLLLTSYTYADRQVDRAETVHALNPWSRMDSHYFKTRAMCMQYFKSGQMDKDEWYEKLNEYCEKHNVLVSVCSVCNDITDVKKDGCGISHGYCYDCLIKVYKEMELEPDEDLLHVKDEMNRKNKMWSIYLEKS